MYFVDIPAFKKNHRFALNEISKWLKDVGQKR